MRFPTSSRAGVRLTALAAIGILLSCTDAPTEPAARSDANASPSAKPAPGVKKPVMHIARVKSDGTLVDGTAVSAERSSTGTYRVKFPPPIGHCAATAVSASFVGFDLSVFRITAQISIGFGSGGAFDDETVAVSLFDTSDGSSEDSSFSLIVVCP